MKKPDDGKLEPMATMQIDLSQLEGIELVDSDPAAPPAVGATVEPLPPMRERARSLPPPLPPTTSVAPASPSLAPAEPAKSGGRSTLVVLAAVVGLVGIGGGVAVGMSMQKKAPPAPAASSPVTAASAPAAAPPSASVAPSASPSVFTLPNVDLGTP